jgi:hypothetical protein
MKQKHLNILYVVTILVYGTAFIDSLYTDEILWFAGFLTAMCLKWLSDENCITYAGGTAGYDNEIL